MEQYTPFLKFGVIGILLLIMVLALIFGIKVFPLVIAKIGGNGNGKTPPRLIDDAGAKSSSWWILEMQRLHKEANIPVIDVLMRIEKGQIDNLKILRDNEFMLRQIRADQRRRAEKKGDSDELL